MNEQEILDLFQALERAIAEEASQKRVLGQASQNATNAVNSLRARIASTNVSFSALEAAAKEAADAEQEAANKKVQASNQIKQSAMAAGVALKRFGSSLANGDRTFSNLADTISTVTTSAAAIGIAAAPLTAGTSVALGAAVAGLGEVFEAGAKQLDRSLPIYQSLGSVGATTAYGFEGLLAQLDKTGGVSFPQFQKSVQLTAQDLVALGGTTARGSSILAKTFGELTSKGSPLARQLTALGYGIDEIGEASANFIATQSRFGFTQGRSAKELADSSAQYLVELDKLSRVTGLSRAEAEDARRQAQADVRFRAKVEELRLAGNETGALRLQQVNEALSKYPGAAESFRASLTGIPLTRDAQGMFVAMRGQFTKAADEAINGQQDVTSIITDTQKAAALGVRDFNKTLQYAGSDAFGAGTLGMYDMAAAQRGATDAAGQARREQDQNLNNMRQATVDLGNFQVAIANAGTEINRIGNEIGLVSLGTLSTAASGVTTALNGVRTGLDLLVDTTYRNINLLNRDLRAVPGSQAIPAAPGTEPEGTPNAVDKLSTGLSNLKDAMTAGAAERTQTRQANTTADATNRLNKHLNNLVTVMGNTNINQTQLTQATAQLKSAINHYNTKLGLYEKGAPVTMSDILSQINMRRDYLTTPQGEDNKVPGLTPDSLAKALKGQIPTFGRGGIATGLSFAGERGPEAVVPLPDGRSIPVNMPDVSSMLNDVNNSTNQAITKLDQATQNIAEMSSQGSIAENQAILARLDSSVTSLASLVDLMRTQNNLSTKILQVSRN